jgi:chromosome segregation and condensation protein ScpB
VEKWELKAGVIAILGTANRSLTLQDLARGLSCDELSAEDALQEYESDLMAADQGMQVRRRSGRIRLVAKAQWADAIKLADPDWTDRALSNQARETLGIVALKHARQEPVTLKEINDSRGGVESAGALQTLRTRKLVARLPKRGPHREIYWATTELFLKQFQLDSLEQLLEAGALHRLFPSVMEDEDDLEPLDTEETPPHPQPEP